MAAEALGGFLLVVALIISLATRGPRVDESELAELRSEEFKGYKQFRALLGGQPKAKGNPAEEEADRARQMVDYKASLLAFATAAEQQATLLESNPSRLEFDKGVDILQPIYRKIPNPAPDGKTAIFHFTSDILGQLTRQPMVFALDADQQERQTAEACKRAAKRARGDIQQLRDLANALK